MEINQDLGEGGLGSSVSTPPDESAVSPHRSSPRFGNWKGRIRPVFYAAYALLVLATVPLIILDIIHAKKRSFQIALAGVGFFAMIITIPVSVWGIINHTVCYTRPAIQKYIIRILWVIPIFELNSWFALRFPTTEIYLDTLRQLYQAYVIYNYVFYLLTFYEEVPDFHSRLAAKPQIKSPPPCCCVKAVPNQRIIDRCKAGVLNYTVIRIVFSVISIITDLVGKFNEGNYSPKFAYFWVTVIVTVSQIWAMFCLVLLRRATLDELRMLPRSTAQFVGIQMVVFFSSFQSVILNLLAQLGVIKLNPDWGYEDVYAFATMLQDFLICLELVPGAIVFSYAFDYQRYNNDSEHRMILSKSLKQMLNVSDVKNNIIEHLGFGGPSFTRQQSDDSAWADQLPDSPASLEVAITPEVQPTSVETESPSRYNPGLMETAPMPDIVPRHPSTHPSTHPPAKNDRSSTEADGATGPKQEELDGRDAGLQNGGYSARDDASTPMDDLSGDSEFSTGDEEDNDIGGRRSPVEHRLRDPATPSQGTPKKRRVRKVSFSGVTFDDMDWDQIKNQRSPTMDSEAGVAKETGTNNTNKEGFGSSDA